jgi:hypothetical protein
MDATPDPMRVLELADAAGQLAEFVAGETGCEAIDAVVVLDALGALGLTITKADRAEADAIAAAYLSFE